MANRIIAAIDRMEKQIAKRVADGLTTAAKVESTRQALDMDFEEYVKFQELKTLAGCDSQPEESKPRAGGLTMDEGMTIYGYLGNTPDVFNRQPAHVKAVLTQIFKELLQRHMGR